MQKQNNEALRLDSVRLQSPISWPQGKLNVTDLLVNGKNGLDLLVTSTGVVISHKDAREQVTVPMANVKFMVHK